MLCLPSPYHTSEGSEYWAGFMFLRWSIKENQPITCVILRDNAQVIRTTNPQYPTQASRSKHGTWEKTFTSLLSQLP